MLPKKSFKDSTTTKVPIIKSQKTFQLKLGEVSKITRLSPKRVSINSILKEPVSHREATKLKSARVV